MTAAGEVAARRRRRRVLVVDDHEIVREGVRARLTAAGFSIVAEAGTGAEAVDAAARHRPDVVLLDLHLPDRAGDEVCTEILERTPEATVIVLSALRDEESVRRAVDAGARGYLLKDAAELDLPAAIGAIVDGETASEPRGAAAFRETETRAAPERPKLSEQEIRILRLVAAGFSNPEIGARLYLSRHTVKEYLSNAMRKLDVTSRVEAVLEATRLGLLNGTGIEAGAARADDRRRVQ